MSEYEDRPSPIPDPSEIDADTGDLHPRLELRAAFSETLSQHGFPNTLVLSRDRATDVFQDRRLEVLDYLQDHEPASVRALAAALDYDKGVISRDLKALAQLDIIEYEDAGRAKAPRLKHSHVAIEPVV
jgi:predicted transcriptional regulator